MTSSDSKILIHHGGSKGYVWSVEDVIKLRSEHHIQGTFVGGISAFKNQNHIHGLPCELSMEEVCVLVGRGLAVIAPPTVNLNVLASSKRKAADREGKGSERAVVSSSGTTSHIIRGQNRKRNNFEAMMRDYESYYRIIEEGDQERSGPKSLAWIAGSYPIKKVSELLQRGKDISIEDALKKEAIVPMNEEEEVPPDTRASLPDAAAAAWAAPLADGSAFAVPMTTAESRLMPGSGLPPGPEDPASPSLWPYPDSNISLLRLLVFADLHSKGYSLSGGVKFGADFLAYPGDPSEYHAQFTVRPVLPDSVVVPMLLKSTARGSHAARKHLLMATVPDLDKIHRSYLEHKDLSRLISSPPSVCYITIAPESGFGKD